MPVYEYKCLDCAKVFDVTIISTLDDSGEGQTVEIIAGRPRTVPRLDGERKCPQCDSKNLQRRFSSFLFKI